jgi:signal transduction histidine kinase/tetratricopeptide (TPR) repeat protein
MPTDVLDGAEGTSLAGLGEPTTPEQLAVLRAVAAGRLEEAERLCREAAAADPKLVWPLEMSGYLRQRHGDMEGAVGALERAVEQGGTQPRVLHALGRLQYRTGRFAKAIATLERAVGAEPKRAESWYLKGLAEFHSGRTRGAIESFTRAVALDPANAVARYHLALSHSRAGNLRKAVACLEQVLAAGAADAAAHYQLGLAHYALGAMSEAAHHFARSLEVDPTDTQARRMFALVGERLTAGESAAGGRRSRKRFRASVVVRVAATSALVFLLAGGGLAWWLVRSAEADDRAVARERAGALADTVGRALLFGRDEEGGARLREVVAAVGREGGVARLRVMDKRGQVLASTDPGEVGTTLPRTDPACASCHAGGGTPSDRWDEFREVSLAGGVPGLELLRPLSATGTDAAGASRTPLGMLQMASSLADVVARRDARRWRAVAVGGVAGVVLTGLIAVLAWLLIRRPLSALEAAVGRVAAGELEVEVTGERGDEVGRLIGAFNRMTRELRRSRFEVEEAQRGLERRVEEATTQLRSANGELREANEKLLAFDRVKSAYVQRAVHDLRAPLNTIVMAVGSLTGGLLGPLPPKQADVLQRAERRADLMTRLIGDLLHLERLRTDSVRPTREAVDPGAVFARTAEAARLRADEKRVLVETSGLEGLGTVSGDPAELESVADNLVDNAVKYTPTGGLVRVRGRREGGEAVLEVSDTGIGVPEGEVARVFDEFFRASNAHGEGREGTGLGLAIVKRIVEAHGGTIGLRSEVGSGTTVTVRLPLQGGRQA